MNCTDKEVRTVCALDNLGNYVRLLEVVIFNSDGTIKTVYHSLPSNPIGALDTSGWTVFPTCDTQVIRQEVCLSNGSEAWQLQGVNVNTGSIVWTKVVDLSGSEIPNATIVNCECNTTVQPEIFASLYSRSWLGEYFPDKWNGNAQCDTIEWSVDVIVNGVVNTFTSPTWVAPTSFTFDSCGNPIEPSAWLNSIISPFGCSHSYIATCNTGKYHRMGMPLPSTNEVEIIISERLSGGACGAGAWQKLWGIWNNGTTSNGTCSNNSTQIVDSINPTSWSNRQNDCWMDSTP
jgi:hypothetical protein